MVSPVIFGSLRLRNLKTLDLDISDSFDDDHYETKRIDCPNLVYFSYRPDVDDISYGDHYVWKFPMLKKLKLNRCHNFMRNLKQLEVLIVSNYSRNDRQLLRELPQLNYLYVQTIDDGKLFGSLEDEFGDRMRIYYRGLPLKYARNKISSLVPRRIMPVMDFVDFEEKDFELYRGCSEHLSDEIHFFDNFLISDAFRSIESSFFRKCIDADQVIVLNDCTLNEDELLRIYGSFPYLKQITGGKVPYNLVAPICPYLHYYC